MSCTSTPPLPPLHTPSSITATHCIISALHVYFWGGLNFVNIHAVAECDSAPTLRSDEPRRDGLSPQCSFMTSRSASSLKSDAQIPNASIPLRQPKTRQEEERQRKEYRFLSVYVLVSGIFSFSFYLLFFSVNENMNRRFNNES